MNLNESKNVLFIYCAGTYVDEGIPTREELGDALVAAWAEIKRLTVNPPKARP